MKIKRWIKSGNDGLDCKDTEELIEQAGAALDSSYASDIMGEVLFEGDDGKMYVGCVEFIISEANPDYAKEALESDCECQEMPDDHADTVGFAIGEADRQIRGWTPSWEYPGFVEWTHPDYDVRIHATPWWEAPEQIPVQFAAADGDIFGDGLLLDLKQTGNTADDVAAYFKVMEENWDKIMEALKAGEDKE